MKSQSTLLQDTVAVSMRRRLCETTTQCTIQSTRLKEMQKQKLSQRRVLEAIQMVWYEEWKFDNE